MKKLTLVAVLTILLVGVVMVVPSGAKPTSVFEFSGKAFLNSGFPCTVNCSGTFSGKAIGAARNPNLTCTAACSMSASYTYKEPGGFCLAGTPAALIGTAKGSVTIGNFTAQFSWTRVGVNAVIVLKKPTGVGVAGFVPPHTCTPTTATVAGVATTA